MAWLNPARAGPATRRLLARCARTRASRRASRRHRKTSVPNSRRTKSRDRRRRRDAARRRVRRRRDRIRRTPAVFARRTPACSPPRTRPRARRRGSRVRCLAGHQSRAGGAKEVSGVSFGCRLFSRDETFDGGEARAATSRLAPATHQHRAPVRARRVGVRAIAAVRIYVRVAEDPHRASLDVEPVRFERGLQDVRRSRARLEGRQGTPRLRGERARHAEGDEREAGEAEASCHLPDAAREGDRERERVRRTRARVSRESGEQPKARVFSYVRWTLEVSLFEHDVSQKKIARIDGSRASVRSADDAEPPASSLQNLWLVSLLTSLSRGRPPPAWAPPPRRPRPWAPKPRASPRAPPPARAAAAPAWAAPGWAARTS